ncbi:TadE/TadG family type IV pilus assembly protein [Arthrobacter sp. Soil764]|uniref:TadE/TadG family type IV pilus assembly protein n=1 Tax=Arthrobacter sp. Soil764 TaxID=1736403 RepID=UPI0009E8C10A|nr:TadE family protein [Arthrobacter sp. Soil764]
MKRSHKPISAERGAVAVEFALVAPILISLVLGIVEFSNFYNMQISVTQAAREGARTMAVKNDQALAKAAAKAGAPGIAPAGFNVSSANPTPFAFSTPACTAGATMKVIVTYQGQALTGLFGSSFKVKGEGAMQCGG